MEHLLWGGGGEYGYSCATDVLNNVYLAGNTGSATGTVIATSSSYQSALGGLGDAYLVKFDALGTRQWGTYYGGTGTEGATASAIDNIGNVYICGATTTNSGTTIATPGSHQPVFGSTINTTNAFLAKFDVCDVAPAQPVSFSGPATLCSGVAGTFTTPAAYGANFYTLSLPGASPATSATNSLSVLPQASGIFTLVAGNACGVSPQQTLNVTVNPTPTVSVSSGSICAGQAFTLSANGAATYTYSGGAVVSPTITSSYSVTGTSTAGCVSANTAISTITVQPLPVISINSGAICLGQSFTLTPGGASTYTYSSAQVVSPTTTTSYSITGTSAAGCLSSNTAVATITVSSIHPTITVNSGAICFGKSFTIAPSGAATYTIQGGSTIVTPLSTSNYTVAGTSTAGCLSSNTAVATVSVNPLPTIGIVSSHSQICEGETATLTASGASTYTFNPGGAATSITVSPTTNTNYQVSGTDANGCKNTANLTLSVDACVGITPNTIVRLSGVEAYPNPTSGLLNIQLSSDSDILIFNAMGQQVYSAKLQHGLNQVDLGGIAKGVYFIRITNYGNLQGLRFVKE